ncbi:MAG: 50S ribosomal protein L17 [Caldilineaceae bacterium]
MAAIAYTQRQVVAYLNDKAVATKVFEELAPRYQDRPGGYVRILKMGKRQGDAADMAVLELVSDE